jgi:hypothetical protein
VRGYLAARGTIAPDELGQALIVAEGNFARSHRLSRRGVRHIVDAYTESSAGPGGLAGQASPPPAQTP